MSSQYSAIHIPAGCDVYVGDSVESLENVGVIPMDADSKIEITYDRSVVQGSKKEEVITSIRNMKAEASTELYQIRLPIINKLAGDVMNVTSVAGTTASGKTFTIAKNFEKGLLYALPGQNADGSAPTVSSVKQGTTALAAADYTLVKDSSGRYGVVLTSSGAADTTKDVVVTYSYTPAAHYKVTMGAATVDIKKRIVRFSKTVDGKLFQVTLYSAAMSNGITLSFPGADEENPVSIPITLEGSLDTSRASGDQLLEIIDEIGVA